MSSISNGVCDIYYHRNKIWCVDYKGKTLFNAHEFVNRMTDEAREMVLGMEGPTPFMTFEEGFLWCIKATQDWSAIPRYLIRRLFVKNEPIGKEINRGL